MKNYKSATKAVKDIKGTEIKFHDVVRTKLGEILLIDEGVNLNHKTKGLIAVNEYVGLKDWVDVYPDGELEILGNVDFVSQGDGGDYQKESKG